MCGIYAGLRVRREALTLRWESVDFDRNLLTVEAAYSKTHETRTIPLHPVLRDALVNLKAVARSDFVFAERDGSPYKDIRHAMDKALKEAKLKTTTEAHPTTPPTGVRA